jgi:hypothetical protein
MIIVLYIGWRLACFPPDYRLMERWRHWRQGKGWQVCPHTQTVVVQCATSDGEGHEYVGVCQACGHESVRFTEEDMRKEKEREARWNWLRLTLRYGVRPVVRETARFCMFIGSFIVVGALLLWLYWGTVEQDVKQGLIELGTHLERTNP